MNYALTNTIIECERENTHFKTCPLVVFNTGYGGIMSIYIEKIRGVFPCINTVRLHKEIAKKM